MKKAVSVLFHPESLIGVGDFGGGICTGGFHIMLPAHVVLVDHHRVAERQAHATVGHRGPSSPFGAWAN